MQAYTATLLSAEKSDSPARGLLHNVAPTLRVKDKESLQLNLFPRHVFGILGPEGISGSSLDAQIAPWLLQQSCFLTLLLCVTEGISIGNSLLIPSLPSTSPDPRR